MSIENGWRTIESARSGESEDDDWLPELAIGRRSAQIKVIVGGAPVTAKFAVSIGADAYAPDATTVTEVVKQAVGSA